MACKMLVGVAVWLSFCLVGTQAAWADFNNVEQDVLDGCYYTNHNYRGDTLAGPVHDVQNYTDCQELCQKNIECFYFAHKTSTKACWLAGKKGVYNNQGAAGSVCGPKYCPTIPTGCSESPDLARFPSKTADETEAAFPSNRQPAKLECWPRNKSLGWYNTCNQLNVLEDVKYKWPAKCTGLVATTLHPGETCRDYCLEHTFCNVWVTVNDTKQSCYIGEGANCYEREDFAGVVEGQRVMHGEVRVIANISGSQVFGLKRVFDQNYFISQPTYAVDACRNACYSNIECEYWQYSKTSGCYAENPNLHLNPANAELVEYPVTYKSWTSLTVEAPNFIAGEYIQHVCPGFGHIPAHFSASWVPDDLQYGPGGPNDWQNAALKKYKKQFPGVQGAPPKAGFPAYFIEEPAHVAQGPSSWNLPLLCVSGLAILSVAAIVSIRRRRTAGAAELEEDAEEGIDMLSHGLVE